MEVIGEILLMCQEPIQKTRLMYKCNLSFGQVDRHLDFLLSKNFVTSFNADDRCFYILTDKGVGFIQKYLDLRDLLPSHDDDGQSRMENQSKSSHCEAFLCSAAP